MAFSNRQQRFLSELHSAIGTNYVGGGTSLQNGVDCSGLVWAAARAAGLRNVPRTSQEQFAHGVPVQMNRLVPGDLIFSNWGNEQGAGHVSIYIGNGKILEAARPGTKVTVNSINVLQGHILGARRYMPGAGKGLPNVSVFARQQVAYHAQASGQGPQGNPAGAAAALANIHPIQVTPAMPLVSPLQTVQGYLAAHAPTQPSLQPPSLQPLPAIGPTPAGISGQLDAIHSRLLKAV